MRGVDFVGKARSFIGMEFAMRKKGRKEGHAMLTKVDGSPRRQYITVVYADAMPCHAKAKAKASTSVNCKCRVGVLSTLLESLESRYHR